MNVARHPTTESCGSQHCITCGDDGVPMTVIDVDDRRGLALCVGEDDDRATVEIGLVDPVAPGQRLLVHAGVALVALDDGDTLQNGENVGAHA